MSQILKFFGEIDHKLSAIFHRMDNIVVSCILYPFAAFFHPKLIWIAFMAIYYFSNQNLEFLAVYIVGVLLCLLTIFVLKKTLKRDRPVLLETVRKPHNFRKKQKNHAMPSGDSIQSALFVWFLRYLGIPLEYLILFHVAVCLGRVYYLCHWLGDTIVASALGCVIAYYLLIAYENYQIFQIFKFQL